MKIYYIDQRNRRKDMTVVEEEQKELRFRKDTVAGLILNKSDCRDNLPDRPSQMEDDAQTAPKSRVASLSHEEKQTGIDSTKYIDSKLEMGQSENNSSIMASSSTHFDKLMPSGAGQLLRKHFTYDMSSSASTPSNSTLRHTGNPQTGESTCATKSSRHCHPMCFARPSSYQTYAASLGDESRPLSKGKRSVPLSSIITERHPLGLGDNFFFDDSDSDEEKSIALTIRK